MLPCLVPVLFAFYLQNVLKFKCKIPAPKGKIQRLEQYRGPDEQLQALFNLGTKRNFTQPPLSGDFVGPSV